MSDPNTAALDPIFWLHHANIDRIWSIWLARDASHANPAVRSWLTSVRFDFHDAARKTVSFTSAQMVNTRTTPMAYQYEDESDPLATVPRLASDHVEGGQTEAQAIPEMIGATEAPMELVGRPATVRLAMAEPTGPARAAVAADGRRMYLHFENVTGERPTTYAVYVNLPQGAGPEGHPERLVGVLAPFGIQQASRPSREHAGNGLHFAFDITGVVEALRANNAWLTDEMRVTFLPLAGLAPPEARRAAPVQPVRVGRVSVYQV
jgi:tyrosinase